MKRLIYILVLTMILVGCTADPTCKVTSRAYMYATIVGGDSLSVMPIGGESLLYDTISLSTLAFPLRPDSTETQFIISRDTRLDTLYVGYENHTVYRDLACGMITTHLIEYVYASEHGLIDSIAIIHYEVMTDKIENIKLFIKARK